MESAFGLASPSGGGEVADQSDRSRDQPPLVEMGTKPTIYIAA